jgi:Na+/H+-dicarboxylate symporter
VALLIVLGIQDSTIHMLIGIWKPALLITVLSLAALGLRMLHISLRYKVPLRTLADKMKDSFLLSLKTFSVETSYTANKTCCEKKLGISRQLTAYGLPIGLICFMPVSTVASTILTLYAAECYHIPVSLVWMVMALFLAVTLAAAGPPTAGIGILTYTVMFSRLGIPAQALTIVLAGDILMGFVIYPVNQAMLQLQLILEADGLGLLKHNILQTDQ